MNSLYCCMNVCLLWQVHKLRQEKDVLESKLKEFEKSLQKLKDCTYQEATQKREYERRVQSVQADLKGANLREQVRHASHVGTSLTLALKQSGRSQTVRAIPTCTGSCVTKSPLLVLLLVSS